jgi:hypothetical protein
MSSKVAATAAKRAGFTTIRRLALCATALAALAVPAAQAAAATVVGATRITVRSALPDYLQVAELLAFDCADVNVALASNGGTASALSQFFDPAPQGGPAEAIDGVYPANYDYAFDPAIPGVYHSGGAGPNEYLTVAFAAPTTLAKIQIYGRGECCATRDLYNVTIYGAGDAVLFSGQLDARLTGNDSLTFDAPTGGVPEPSAWALMILGFGGAGAALRGRRQRAPACA